MLRHLPHPLAGSVPQVVSPMQLAEAPLRFDRAPPLLGQHTAESELPGANSDCSRQGAS